MIWWWILPLSSTHLQDGLQDKSFIYCACPLSSNAFDRVILPIARMLKESSTNWSTTYYWVLSCQLHLSHRHIAGCNMFAFFWCEAQWHTAFSNIIQPLTKGLRHFRCVQTPIFLICFYKIKKQPFGEPCWGTTEAWTDFVWQCCASFVSYTSALPWCRWYYVSLNAFQWSSSCLMPVLS